MGHPTESLPSGNNDLSIGARGRQSTEHDRELKGLKRTPAQTGTFYRSGLRMQKCTNIEPPTRMSHMLPVRGERKDFSRKTLKRRRNYNNCRLLGEERSLKLYTTDRHAKKKNSHYMTIILYFLTLCLHIRTRTYIIILCIVCVCYSLCTLHI